VLTFSCGGREAGPGTNTTATGAGGAGTVGVGGTTGVGSGTSSGTSGQSTTGFSTTTSSGSTTGGGASGQSTTGFGSTTGSDIDGTTGFGSTTTFGSTTGRCGNASSGGSGGAPPSGPAPGAKAMALQRKQIPPLPPSPSGSSSTSGSGGGSELDPEQQFLFIGTEPFSCQKPYAVTCGTWGLTISIAPAAFKPGQMDLCGIGSFSAEGPDRGGGDCSGGGGSYDQGRLEILGISPDIVRIRLSGTRSSDLDADGEYDVVRCH